MRKNYLLLSCFLLLLVILVSCKQDAGTILQNQNTTATIDKILSLNPEDQKAAFIVLPAKEKSLIWSNHLNQFKERIRLSDEQELNIDILISKLTSNTFINDSKENIEFKAEEPEIHMKFRNLFGDALSKQILNSLQPIVVNQLEPKNNTSLKIIQPNLAPPASCTCSTKSDYCSCPSELMPYHCPWCHGDGCAASDYGCGTLWLYSCNSTCQGYPSGTE